MPKVYDHLGRGSKFRIKTREAVLSLWLSGYTEEQIAKEYRSGNSNSQNKISIEDVKDIIAFQQTEFGDDFKKLRKWRQKEFIDKAWKTIHIAQDVLLEGLQIKDNKGSFKTTPVMASNIIVAMKDKLKEIEGKENSDETPEKEKLTPEEDKDLKEAMERIKKQEEEKEEIKQDNEKINLLPMSVLFNKEKLENDISKMNIVKK